MADGGTPQTSIGKRRRPTEEGTAGADETAPQSTDRHGMDEVCVLTEVVTAPVPPRLPLHVPQGTGADDTAPQSTDWHGMDEVYVFTEVVTTPVPPRQPLRVPQGTTGTVLHIDKAHGARVAFREPIQADVWVSLDQAPRIRPVQDHDPLVAAVRRVLEDNVRSVTSSRLENAAPLAGIVTACQHGGCQGATDTSVLCVLEGLAEDGFCAYVDDEDGVKFAVV